MIGAIMAVGASLSTQVPATDFGVRIVGAPSAPSRAAEAAVNAIVSGKHSLSAAAALGNRWGRVTSTYRSPAHNRRVGGVANSFHLSGRAVDIARRAGVSHSAIAAAYRNAGYRLIESLDEGDHSHFAFDLGGGTSLRRSSVAAAAASPEATQWKVVFAPR